MTLDQYTIERLTRLGAMADAGTWLPDGSRLDGDRYRALEACIVQEGYGRGCSLAALGWRDDAGLRSRLVVARCRGCGAFVPLQRITWGFCSECRELW